MHIVLVLELYAPSVGGVQSRFNAWARELARQGHEVEVWCIGHTPGLARSEVMDGVLVKRLVANNNYVGGIGRRHWPTIVRFCWALWQAGPELDRFDAIVMGKWPILPALFVPLPERPSIFFDWCELRSGRVWAAVYRRIAHRKRLRHIAIHDGIAEWLTRQGTRAAHITVIGSAAPPARGVVARLNRHILFLGRLSEHKGPLLLLQAFVEAELARRGHVLHFAGDGPQAVALAAASRGVSGVMLHGRVDNATKTRLLSECTLLAIPSLREGFPVVVAEACSVGTPTLTIAARDNGTASVISALKCGWVVDGTVEGLSAGLTAHADMDSPEWQHCSAMATMRAADSLSIESQTRTLLAAMRLRPQMAD